MHKKKIWITWERQRRSLELAKALQAGSYIFSEPPMLKGILKYPYLTIKTILLIIKEKPHIVFVQNPSIVLTSIVAVLKRLFLYKLVVDRHSNFKLDTIRSRNLKWKLFHFLSKYTIRSSDLTIVTNKYLFDVTNKWGGYGFVLEDKIPELTLGKKIELAGEKNIVFISSFSEDEPVTEVIEAAMHVNEKWMLYITGSHDTYDKKPLLHKLPPNVKLTNFLPEEYYQSLLISSDLLIVLTKGEYVLNCGAYEAVAISKPVILSDTETIRNYFKKGVIFSKYDPPSIAASIKKGIREADSLQKDICELRKKLSLDWSSKFNNLVRITEHL